MITENDGTCSGSKDCGCSCKTCLFLRATGQVLPLCRWCQRLWTSADLATISLVVDLRSSSTSVSTESRIEMSRPSNGEKRVRLNLEFPERMRERLEVLRGITEADSVTEVIRRSVILYEFVLSPSFVSRSALDDVLKSLR